MLVAALTLPPKGGKLSDVLSRSENLCRVYDILHNRPELHPKEPCITNKITSQQRKKLESILPGYREDTGRRITGWLDDVRLPVVKPWLGLIILLVHGGQRFEPCAFLGAGGLRVGCVLTWLPWAARTPRPRPRTSSSPKPQRSFRQTSSA